MKSILFLVSLVISTLARAADLPRVAVVPDSPEPSIAAFADFLSASLATASDRYALVERAEITKLASEAEIQKLAADQRLSALAKLAKADGLIIVGADNGDPKLRKLTLRLTSTNNGLVLRSLILGGKESEFPEAAKLAAGVLRFPCERLTHGDAKPPIIVSLLGIRPAFEIDRALETTLNLAVAQQLSAQSGIAVSERWKMNDLVFERSLADEKSLAFATGTVLLDGSYTRKGDQLEFSLRLRKAESEEGRKLELKGSATKPTDLAQQIAKLIATESGQSGEAVAWNALEEGEQYADLGSWFLDRKLFEDAARACESAVALGFDGKEVLWARAAAYQGYFTSWHGYEIIHAGVFGMDALSVADFKWRVNLTIRKSQCLIELMNAQWKGDRTNPSHSVTLHLVGNLRVLEAICVRGEQLGLATEARSLRALTREIVERGEARVGSHFTDGDVRRVYMFDTPEAAVQDLRRLLGRRDFTTTSPELAFRYSLWQTAKESGPWRLVDWTETDNQKGRAHWKEFIAELQGSKVVLNRIDGLSIAFQESRSDAERASLLDAYCSLVESDLTFFTTREGQMWLGIFGNNWIEIAPSLRPRFEERFTRIWLRIFKDAEWVESNPVKNVSSSIRHWDGTFRTPGRTQVPQTLALELLDAVEAYAARAKQDPRWQKEYRDYIREWLLDIPGLIVSAYPDLKKSRIKPSDEVDGSVAMRAWKPRFPGAAPIARMKGDFLAVRGDSVFIPSEELGVIELDTRTMEVSRVIGCPIKNCNFIGGLATNEKSLLMNANHRLFTIPLSGGDEAWKEIEIPGSGWDGVLTWHLEGWGEEFFVGSIMLDDSKAPPRMLAGKVTDGKLTWLVSSDRRPMVNPLDGLEPLDTHLAYRNAAGNTVVLLERLHRKASMVELESGKELFPFVSMGQSQSRGEMPLHWNFDKDAIGSLVALDPAKMDPRLIFKPITGSGRNLPGKLKEMPSVYDGAKPEFRGQCIAAIVYGGHLWILKRQPSVGGKSAEKDPNDFRLLRLNLDGGTPVVIPLRYDVPVSFRMQKDGRASGLERPVINQQSLTATQKGLLFAISGKGYLTGVYFDRGIPTRGGPASALLYITWDDINAWLAKNAPESAKPASP
ncbi:MAG: hypothetical protein ABI600_15855 [Luteolibacter sp.]